MKLKIAQVIGLNTDQKAAQVISTIQDLDNVFLAILELTCDDAFTKGRQALSELSDFYFEVEGSAHEKLTKTYQEAEKKLEGNTFTLSLASISGKVLYILGKDEMVIYLKRDDKLSILSSLGSGQIVSGFLTEGDKLLFATKTLISVLGEDLSKALNLSPEDFEEDITARLGGSGLERDGLAGLLVEIEAEVETILNVDQELKPQEEANYFKSLNPESKLIAVKEILVKILGNALLLRSYFPKTNRGRLILGIILLLILGLGVGYKYKASKDAQNNTQFNQLIIQAKDDFNAAKSLSSLNPPDAKSKLDLAKSEVNKALSLKPRNSEAEDLKKQIEADSSQILQEVSVSQFPLFLDMDLVKKNFRADKMSLSGNKLLVMDPAVKTLVLVDLSKKSNQILAGEEQLGDAKGFSLNGGLAFIYSKDKGTLSIDTTNQKLSSVAKADSTLGSIADIYGFAGNVYLLDSGQIWKYIATSSGYSDKREYLTSDTKVDLSNVLRMQIESSVYVLKQGGEILRFTRGVKDNFSVGGLDKNIKDPKSFFVSSDTDNLYILDSGNSRLLILTKTGSYKGQITGEKFGSASDLVVDEGNKKVYLLDGSKIYSVDLK